MQKVYQLLVASMIGIELFLGIVVAPAIFYPKGLDGVLDHFQSGLIMGHIFSSFGYVLLAVSVLCFLYEIPNYKRQTFAFFTSLAIMLLSLVFVFYFCSHILQAQTLGKTATSTPYFQQLHLWSSYTLKAIVVLQCVLFFRPFCSRRYK